MAVYFNKKKKPLFHKPQKTGVVRPIPSSLPMKIVSVVGLVLLAGLIALSIYGYTLRNGQTLNIGGGLTMTSGTVFLFLPIVGVIICLLFRLALKVIPLDMWRLPASLREAVQKTDGKYLRFCTLCLETETTLLFLYITWGLINYGGGASLDGPVIAWVIIVVATIIIFGRYDYIAASKIGNK